MKAKNGCDRREVASSLIRGGLGAFLAGIGRFAGEKKGPEIGGCGKRQVNYNGFKELAGRLTKDIR